MNATSRPSSALQLIHAPSRSESTQEPLDSLEFPSPPTALQMPDQTASGQPNRSDLPPELWAEIAKYVATTYEDDESRRKTLRALSRTCRNSEREAKRRYAPCRELICENISLQSEDDVEELRHCVEAAKGENLAAKRLRGIKSICIDGTVRDQRWVSSLMSEDCWMRQIITELVVLYGIDLSGMSREDFHELFSSFQSVCLKLDGVRFKDGDALTSLFYVADVMQIIVEDVAAVTCDSASESVESVESEDQRSESEPLHEGIRYLDIMVTSLEDVARVRDRTWENTIRSLLVQETTVTVFFPKLDPFTTSEGSYHFDFKPTIDSLRELQGQYGDAASESKILEFVGYNSPQSCAAKVLFFTQAGKHHFRCRQNLFHRADSCCKIHLVPNSRSQFRKQCSKKRMCEHSLSLSKLWSCLLPPLPVSRSSAILVKPC